MFLVLLLVYPLWGVPVHLIANFFLTRALLRRYRPAATGAIALALNVLMFAPLVIKAQSFFGDIYVPWYLAYALSPPSPGFSMTGLAAVAALSLLGSTIWIATAKR